ncbi:mechanosensitive ion channel family protein [bacterium]|nr:mechanosensitive ion channel family protein [bacterium]
MLARLKRRPNLLMFVLSLICCLITMFSMPEVNHPRPVSTPSAETEDPSLPLPRIGPRARTLNPFDTPFLFRLGDSDKLTGLEREQQLLEQYQHILSQLDGRQVEVTVAQAEGMTTLDIDGHPFATVLQADCPDYYNRLTEAGKKKLEYQLAMRWKALLEKDLARESALRAPDSMATRPYLMFFVFFFSLALHALTDSLSRRFLHNPGWPVKGFIWLSCISFGLILHPDLKPLAIPIINGALRPVFFGLIISAVCQGLHRIGCLMLERYIDAYVRQGEGARRQNRVETLARGGRFLVGTVVVLIGVGWFAAAVGVDLGKVFAGAGVAGLALGVVGKDILIDYFYGLNVMLDDQFNLGDFIETPVATGIVENFNLRTTRVRELDGGLSIVTNSKLTVIKNHSRDFANADFRIAVPYNADVKRALQLIADEIRRMSENAPELLEATPMFMGVHELGESAVTLRALVKTGPLKQWHVTRELNQRILERFQEENMDIAYPVLQILRSDA